MWEQQLNWDIYIIEIVSGYTNFSFFNCKNRNIEIVVWVLIVETLVNYDAKVEVAVEVEIFHLIPRSVFVYPFVKIIIWEQQLVWRYIYCKHSEQIY